ncbi:MAG: hypothetical protein C0404_08120 [Verrucomicrobia bacterium]|nr:hypothetical protein [Verrucomicrobiota bacterium]
MKNKGIVEKLLAAAVTAASAIVAVAAIHWWLQSGPAGIELRLPGMDDPHGKQAKEAKEGASKIGEFFEKFAGKPAESVASWPGFRGPNHDNLCAGDVNVATNWPGGAPAVLWSVALGEGHAAPAVHKGRVYLLDYDDKKKRDALRCLSLADGAEIWRRSYKVDLKRNHGMSRTVPAVTDKHVVTLGPKCHVMCVDTQSGDLRWSIDLVAKYGTTVPGWYTGQCPMIDDGVAILAPAGTNVLMMGVDCETGKTLWSTPNPGKIQMSHASIMPMKIGSRRMYVYSGVGGTVGVAADGENRGGILWKTAEWNASVIAPSPIQLDDGRILLCAGYGAGNMLVKVTEENGSFKVQTIARKTAKEGVASEQQTPLYVRGHVFSVQPKDAGELRNQFVCYRSDGTLAWASGKSNVFGLGPYILAGDKFLVLDDEGMLTIAEMSVERFSPLVHTKILEGPDSWGPLVLVDGKLLARDLKRMVCVDMKAGAAIAQVSQAWAPGSNGEVLR